MSDREQTPERPEEENHHEAPRPDAAPASPTGTTPPADGFFRPVPEPERPFGISNTSPTGGVSGGAGNGPYAGLSEKDYRSGVGYPTAPNTGYRSGAVPGAGGGSSSGFAPGRQSTPGTPMQGGQYSPGASSFSYPGQPSPHFSAPPKKTKKRGNTGLVVAVIVLAFMLVVGLVTAGVYFAREGFDGYDGDRDPSQSIGQGGGSDANDEKTPSGGNHAGAGVQYGDSSGFVNQGSIVSDDAISNAAVFCSKSVVAITTSSASYSAFYGNYVTKGAGSGVLYAEQTGEDGSVTGSYIVTNNHVIEGASEITVTLADGTQYPAEMVGTDAQTDVAVIYIGATDLKDSLAAIGSSESLLLGQTVLAIGNPLGELAGTVTDGIISCLAREIDVDGIKMNLLQTNAAVNPGNSGGGLFNLSGQLVGLVNAKSSGEGIEGLGFAIPIDTVKEIASDLMENGYVTGRPKLGVSGYEVTSANYQNYRSKNPELWNYINQYYSAGGGRLLEGWYIFDDSSVQYTDPDNTFSKGDVISAIGGNRITGQNSITELLSDCKIGDTVTVTVWRLVESGNKFRPGYSIQSHDIDVVLVDSVSIAESGE